MIVLGLGPVEGTGCGRAAETVMEAIGEALEDVFPVRVEALPAMDSPLEAFDMQRGQHSAPVVLRSVLAAHPSTSGEDAGGDRGRPVHPDAEFRIRPGATGRKGRSDIDGATETGVPRFRAGRNAATAAGADSGVARDRPPVRAGPLPGAGMRDETGNQYSPIRPEAAGVVRRVRGGINGDAKMKANWQILVVDDEEVMCESLAAWLREDGYEVDVASSGREAIEKARQTDYAIYFVDLKMPGGMDGIETMMEIRRMRPDASIIIITAYATVDTAIAAMKEGAQEYIVKPCNPEEISLLVSRIIKVKNLQRENRILRQKLTRQYQFHDIVSKSPKMHEILDLAGDVASLRSTVLIRGESGTGKELVARAIHYSGERATKPFIAVSCAALAETLLESELFGYEKGSFTGAAERKKGKFELAAGGTIFLDEIGDIGPKLQADLLRVLQEKSFYRVGGSEEVRVDVRVIAATHKDLKQAVEEGTFREDLYYRLNVIEIRLPPLRERREDVPLLAAHFVDRLSHEIGKDVRQISDAAMRILMDHDWPGNVRELENAIERAIVSTRTTTLAEDDFVFLTNGGGARSVRVPDNMPIEEMEKLMIEATLRRTGGNVKEAAVSLGIDRSTLYEKLKRFGVER